MDAVIRLGNIQHEALAVGKTPGHFGTNGLARCSVDFFPALYLGHGIRQHRDTLIGREICAKPPRHEIAEFTPAFIRGFYSPF